MVLVVVAVAGVGVGGSGGDTRTFKSQSGWCESAVLMQYDGNGSQKQEVKLWKERASSKWCKMGGGGIVSVVNREPGRRGRNPSDSILFCELSRLPLSAASSQDRPHPRARSLVCQLGWAQDRSCLVSRLFSLALSRPHPISILGIDTRCVLGSVVKVVFSRGK